MSLQWKSSSGGFEAQTGPFTLEAWSWYGKSQWRTTVKVNGELIDFGSGPAESIQRAKEIATLHCYLAGQKLVVQLSDALASIKEEFDEIKEREDNG